MSNFKSLYSFEQRLAESERVRQKYPDRIPVICEKHSKSKAENIDKVKYLVPSNLNCGQFVFTIRKRLSLAQEEALYLFVNGSIPSTHGLISEIYDKEKDADGFLYMNYAVENTFGH